MSMASIDPRHLPTEWLNRIWHCIRSTSGDPHNRNMKQNRQAVITWAEKRPGRRTPWGVQYLFDDTGREIWMPYLSVQPTTLCGRWFREEPHQCINCGRQPSCQSHTPRVGIPYCLGELTYLADNYSFLPDPSIDLSKDIKVHVPPPETDRCRITELPTELLQHIISYLVPNGTTYQFFQARVDATRSLQIIQKFTPEPAFCENIPSLGGDTRRFPLMVQYGMTDRPPATATAHMALAATCRRLQDEMYAAFFGENNFILHITAGTIQSQVRSDDFRLFQTWSRILPDQTKAKNPKAKHSEMKQSATGPLTTRAASYLRNLTLIISLPSAPISKDIGTLEAKVSETSSILSAAKSLDRLTIEFQQSTQKLDRRYALQILNIDSLEAKVAADGKLTVAVFEPIVQPVRSWNKAQRVLTPLLNGPKGAKEVVLKGPISSDLATELEHALKSADDTPLAKRPLAIESDCADKSSVPKISAKRRRRH